VASVAQPDDVLGFELFELLPDAIIAVDRQGVIRYANRQAGTLFGQAPATLVSARVETLLPQHLREWHIAHRIKYTSEPRMRPMGTGLDLVAKRADGTTFPVDIMLSPLTHLAEPMVLAVVRDMTERSAAQETLRRSQARLAAIVTSSVDAIIGKTLDGIVTSWNEAAERMFGYSAGEMIGQSIRRLIPADRQAEEDMILARLARSECVQHFETVRLAKNGRTFDASVTISPMRDAKGCIIAAAKIIRDISERKQAEQALQATKDRLQFALDAARLGWWQYEPLYHVVLWDTRSKEMFDVAEDKTDTGELTKRVHPEDLERVWSAVEVALDPTDPKPFATEFRHLRRDGEVRWVEAHGLTHFEGASPERRVVSIVGTAQDITERKWREEERRERAEREHLLMLEVNHRAKNMLGLVQAIARQSADREPEDFIGRFTERIQALTANQDLLMRHEWHRVDINDLVRAQLTHFADPVGSRIAMHGPKLRLNAAAAEGIGLALHELATNAGKYGALSTDAGRVDIGWGTEGDAFTMSWTEREGPPVSAPHRRGFGTTVMKTMIERSLDGTVDLDYAPSGMTWRFACPAANALETREQQKSGEGENRTDGTTGKAKV
jgi:PAS domain S-box-containing protein